MKKSLINYSMLGVISSLFLSAGAHAIDQTGITVKRVGTGTTDVYIEIQPNPDNCAANGVYFKHTNTDGSVNRVADMALSIGLTAKAAAKTVRIGYDQESNNYCYGKGIYIE